MKRQFGKAQKLFIIFLFILVGGFAWGQTYKYYKLVDTGKVWCNIEDAAISNPKYYINKFDNDTIINNIHYLTLFECVDTMNKWVNTLTYYREDSTKKVFVISNHNFNKEYLLYDFNLNLNDTVNTGGYLNFILDSINKILIGNDFRKILYFSANKYLYDTWIEGVGTINTPFTMPLNTLLGGDPNFLCYKENNVLMFSSNNLFVSKNFQCNKCPKLPSQIITSTYYKNINNQISISPNPATNELKIDKGYKVESYKIFDIAGKEILIEKNNLNNNTINVSLLDKGIYFVRIITDDNKVYNSKFIKE